MENNNKSEDNFAYSGNYNSADFKISHNGPTIDTINKKNNLIDYQAPDGSGTISLDKSTLLQDLYIIMPSAYPLLENEFHKIMDFLESNNDRQLWKEILIAYAYGCFIPSIIACRALLESLVDKLCGKSKIKLFNEKENRVKWLNEKIKELNLGTDLKNFIYFNNFISNKAAHEIYEIYGRKFDKIQATILLSCSLLIINEIKEKYVQSTTTKSASSN